MRRPPAFIPSRDANHSSRPREAVPAAALLFSPCPSPSRPSASRVTPGTGTGAKGPPSRRASARSSGKDPRFDKLVPKDAGIEKLADGFDWAEGPVWVKEAAGTCCSPTCRKRRLPVEGRARASASSSSPAATPATSRRGGEPGSNGLRSTSEAGSSSASTATAASRGSTRTAKFDRRWPTSTRASGSTAPTTLSSIQRRPLLHRPALRPAEQFEDPTRELDFSGVYRLRRTAS